MFTEREKHPQENFQKTGNKKSFNNKKGVNHLNPFEIVQWGP